MLGLMAASVYAEESGEGFDKPYCGAIGTKGEGWYSKNGLVEWDRCEKCAAKCGFAGTEREGWYSSCNGNLIKLAKCQETQQTPEEPAIAKEQVKCKFANSDGEQKCFTDNGKFACSGNGSCSAEVSGEKGTKLKWKSSCRGYASTVIDGKSEYVKFKCSAEQNVALPKPDNASSKPNKPNNAYPKPNVTRLNVTKQNVTKPNVTGDIGRWDGFRQAYWQCYDGSEEKQGDESSCKPSPRWQSYAKGFCESRCSKDGSKCGVNSFSVSGKCSLGIDKAEVIAGFSNGESESKPLEDMNSGEDITKKEEIITEEEAMLICKDSCPLDGKCYPFGYRASGKFCSDAGSFIIQSKGYAACDNNFECSSNICVDGKCVSSGVFEKLLKWFRNLFGEV